MPSERLKTSIARSFSDAAISYDRWAALQRRVARRLGAMLPGEAPPGLIVDVGCGTGAMTEPLLAGYPGRSVVAIDFAPGMIDVCRKRWPETPQLELEVADAEQYTPEGPCGLVVSSFSVHWLACPAAAVERMSEWLVPGGVLAVAVPVDGSLPELRKAHRSVVGTQLWGPSLPSGADYLDWMSRAGLSCRDACTETFTERFDGARQALRSFKGIGATFRYQESYTPMTPTATRELLCYYDQHFADADGRVPVTYEVLLFVAEKQS